MWCRFYFVVTCAALAQTPCEQLKTLAPAGTVITSAEPLSTHCRVAATLKPSSDSDIKLEVWLPAHSAWNGKFLAIGGGGWVGSINTGGMMTALQEGYATASTDTGHAGGSASFAAGHPEKLVDFSHRAVHEMTVTAKAVLSAYYGRSSRLSYWNGCSTGGKARADRGAEVSGRLRWRHRWGSSE